MQLIIKSLILLCLMVVNGHAEEAKPIAKPSSAMSKESSNASAGETTPVAERIPAVSKENSKAPVAAAKPAAKPSPAISKDSSKTAGGQQKLATTPSKPVTNPLPEMSIGSAKAPVVMISYSSLTCGHCRNFYTSVLPQIQKKYIDSGKLRVVVRDYPGDQLSLQAHQLAWSKGGIKYLDFMKILYSTQDTWLTASDPVAALKSIAAQNGVSGEQFDACLKDQELLDKIIHVRLEGQQKYHITATPTFVINAKIHQGELSIKQIEDIMKPYLEPVSDKEKKPSLEEGKKPPLEKGKRSFFENVKKSIVEESKKPALEDIKKPIVEKVKKNKS